MVSFQSPIKLAAAKPPNPRKVAKGTSYNATGLIPPPNVDAEAGSSLPVTIIDVVPELVSPYSRLLAYTRMMNDAGVDVSVRAVKTPVLGAEYFMEPYSDDPNDVLISEFVWDNIAGGMSAPFLNSLEDILRMYEDGYSTLEKAYENREWSPKAKGSNSKNYTMLKKLGVRPASTHKDLTYDNNGGLQQIIQSAIQADGSIKEVPLDISKLLVFTFNRKGGDVRGKSILRTAYPHWYYKTHFYKIDAIQKERHSLGVPKGKLMPGYTPKDRSLLRQMLRNIRSNEESFMLLPPNVDVEFAEVHGNLVDVLKSAEHHNTMILLNVMAQFLAMGIEHSGGGGGKSTAGGQIDMFMKSLRYMANYIADIINMYLIPELVVWNFPTKNFPKLQVRNIGETRDLQMFAAALANLLAQGGIVMDDPTEAWMRRVFDMPAKDPTTIRSTPAEPSGGGLTPPVGGSQSGGATNGKGKGNVKPAGSSGGNKGIPPNAPQ